MPTEIDTVTGNTVKVKFIREILRGHDIDGNVELHLRMDDNTTLLLSRSELTQIVTYITDRLFQ